MQGCRPLVCLRLSADGGGQEEEGGGFPGPLPGPLASLCGGLVVSVPGGQPLTGGVHLSPAPPPSSGRQAVVPRPHRVVSVRRLGGGGGRRVPGVAARVSS